MERINTEEVKVLYENVTEVWPTEDLWHSYSKRNIDAYVKKQSYSDHAYILNAGSGGSTYGIANRMHHLDIAENLIAHLPEFTVGSMEQLPFTSASFSDIICVGSVLNYCDAVSSIMELARVVTPGGSLILEFESSWGFEHIQNKGYKQSALLVEVEYSSQLTRQWVYDPSYIIKILEQAGFKIVDSFRFHYLSGLHYSRYQDSNKASKYTAVDSFIRRLPGLKNRSNNVIYRCVKI